MNPRLRESKLPYKGCEITIWSGVKDTGWPFSDALVVFPDGSRHLINPETIDKVCLLDASSPWHTEHEACKHLASLVERKAKALIDSRDA